MVLVLGCCGKGAEGCTVGIAAKFPVELGKPTAVAAAAAAAAAIGIRGATGGIGSV